MLQKSPQCSRYKGIPCFVARPLYQTSQTNLTIRSTAYYGNEFKHFLTISKRGFRSVQKRFVRECVCVWGGGVELCKWRFTLRSVCFLTWLQPCGEGKVCVWNSLYVGEGSFTNIFSHFVRSISLHNYNLGWRGSVQKQFIRGRGSTKDCSHFVRSISLHNYNLGGRGSVQKQFIWGRGSTNDCSHFVRSISSHDYNLGGRGRGSVQKQFIRGRGSTKDCSHFVRSISLHNYNLGGRGSVQKQFIRGRGSTKDCSHFVRSISLHNYNLGGRGGVQKRFISLHNYNLGGRGVFKNGLYGERLHRFIKTAHTLFSLFPHKSHECSVLENFWSTLKRQLPTKLLTRELFITCSAYKNKLTFSCCGNLCVIKNRKLKLQTTSYCALRTNCIIQ